jgi:hypothetical protein
MSIWILTGGEVDVTEEAVSIGIQWDSLDNKEQEKHRKHQQKQEGH